MDNRLALVTYLLLFLGGVLIGSTPGRRYIAMALLALSALLAVLMGFEWLPAPSSGWLSIALLFFGVWVGIGILASISIGLMQARPRWLRLIGVLLVVAMLSVLRVFEFGELGNPNLGWGLFALPAFIAGMLLSHAVATRRRQQVFYILSWLMVVAAVTTSHYLTIMDMQEVERGYAAIGVIQQDPTTYRMQEIVAAATYLVGTLSLLILPLLIQRRLKYNYESKRREIFV